MVGGGMRGRGGQPFHGGFRSQNYGGNGGPNSYNNRGNGGYQMRGRGGHMRGDGQEQRVKYDGDYDFEKANEQFQETLSHLKDEVQKVKIDDESEKTETKKNEDSGNAELPVGDMDEHDDKQCYDKTKSFFDTISCEALERAEGTNQQQGRPNWRKERELNQETFGQSAVRNYAYRRGQPRGAGMGGGYRRGGYGGGYNNNNNRGGYNKYR
jgi:protein LSM14